MSRILITSAILFALAAPSAHGYSLPQPAQLPPIETVAGEGIGYTCPGCPISLSSDYLNDSAVYLHEVGHHVDYTIPETDPFRYRFRELIGDSRPWRTSPNSPHEKFAEAYSFCARRDPATVTLFWLRRSFGYDYRPTVRKHRLVCRTISNAIARYPNLFR